jgi:hypothetical protein
MGKGEPLIIYLLNDYGGLSNMRTFSINYPASALYSTTFNQFFVQRNFHFVNISLFVMIYLFYPAVKQHNCSCVVRLKALARYLGTHIHPYHSSNSQFPKNGNLHLLPG